MWPIVGWFLRMGSVGLTTAVGSKVQKFRPFDVLHLSAGFSAPGIPVSPHQNLGRQHFQFRRDPCNIYPKHT
jgi:hypothetical protein